MGVGNRHFLPFFIGGRTLYIHPCPGSLSWVVTCFLSVTLQKLNLQPHSRLRDQEPYDYSPSHSFVSLFHSSFKKGNLFLPLFLEISFYVYLSIYTHLFYICVYLLYIYLFILVFPYHFYLFGAEEQSMNSIHHHHRKSKYWFIKN